MRGPKCHLKRLRAPSHWMLDKLGGVFAPRPRPGPHKIRDCLPLCLILRNRLKYALNYRETHLILKQRLVKVDGKIRTDPKYPAGFMDVVTMEKSGDKLRLLYDTKGRFMLHKIDSSETGVKLCKITKRMTAAKGIPFVVTHDGRTIRYPDPNIKKHDTALIDLETGKIKEWVRFKPGCMVMTVAGSNQGRVGEVLDREKHPGSFDVVHVKDGNNNQWATRLENVFVIGSSTYQPLISLPSSKGLRMTIVQEREKKLRKQEEQLAGNVAGNQKKKTKENKPKRKHK
eukprot:NODE_3283_length_996_cov_141.830840_g3137_i0.p1 GENE.NODE_3283_length_996_cov_141.830840_g3137_i0~~NODE_3283_length_996_cov_141.830840_g3137_i0.p1  ORF type:complete len:303 (+),score=76.10 NODE_3283_length_996_cov_141.830840_g3137_i0:54-911(+)